MPTLKTLSIATRTAQRELSNSAFSWFSCQELFTADEIGTLLDLENPGHPLRRWREQGKVIGLRVAQGHVYPAFQFDLDRQRVRPEVIRANLTQVGLSPWVRLEWWASRET